jgi:hypothetical protein
VKPALRRVQLGDCGCRRGARGPPQLPRQPSRKLRSKELRLAATGGACVCVYETGVSADVGSLLSCVLSGSGESRAPGGSGADPSLDSAPDPACGVLIDGRWVHDVPLQELRGSLCVIPQEPTLFRCAAQSTQGVGRRALLQPCTVEHAEVCVCAWL